MSSIVIRVLAQLVEADARAEWVREWEAELSIARGQRRNRVRLVSWAAEDAIRRVFGTRAEFTLGREVLHAWRTIRRAPGYALAVAGTLALGIGANTALFSVIDAYVIRPLDLESPDRVVLLNKNTADRYGLTSAPNYLDWAEQSTSFDGMAAVHLWSTTLTGLDAPRRVSLAQVRAGFFQTVGVSPMLGRAFTRDETVAGSSAVAILSHRLWVDSYGADPSIIGRSITTSGEPRTVVGVLPAGSRIPPFTSDVWVPLEFTEDALDVRGRNNLYVVGRLREGLEIESAEAEMDLIGRRLADAYPRANEGWTVSVRPLQTAVVGGSVRSLWILMAAAGSVLLIACVNVAGLVVARGLSRDQELAIRVSLGASRTRLVVQLLSETLTLAVIGGTAGVALSILLTGPIGSLIPASLSVIGPVSVDGRVLGFAFVISLATGLLAGLAPALRLSTAATGRGASAGVGALLRRRGVTGDRNAALVVVQFGLATVLLVGATLMARTLSALYAVDLGVRQDGVTAFRVTFPDGPYPTPNDVILGIDQILDELGNRGDAVASTSHLPLRDGRLTSSVLLEGRSEDMSTNGPSGAIKVVTPGYFELMGVSLKAGRVFNADDVMSTEAVALINQTAAREFWPGEDPLGRWVAYAEGEEGGHIRRRIVGIVGDVRAAGPSHDPVAEVYQPHAQTTEVWSWFGSSMSFVVRTRDAGLLSLSAAQSTLSQVDADLPVVGLAPLSDVLDDAVGTSRFNGTLISLFAVLALGLAVVGLHGVTSFTVRRRRKEIGIRMALGASKNGVVSSVLMNALRTALVGCAIGLVAASLMARVLSSMVWGVSPYDPIAYAATIGILCVIALAAAWLPARMAGNADPVETLAGG